MKILQVNSVYNRGSTGKIVHDMHVELQKKGIESIVCYGNGPLVHERNVYRISSPFYRRLQAVISRISGVMYGGCLMSTHKLISIIEKEKPDVVHLQCINGHIVNIYKLVAWLKKNRIRTVLTLHAEIMYTGGCDHSVDCEQWKDVPGCTHCPRWREKTRSWFFDRTSTMWMRMKDAFAQFDEYLTVIGVSKWIADRSNSSVVLGAYAAQVIYNGISVGEIFHSRYPREEIREILKKYSIRDDKPIVIHVTPSLSNPVKGSKYFVDLANGLRQEFTFVVAGANDGERYDSITCIPFIKNQKDLASLYNAASVFVITSIRDNYPTVCLEANCCGTPVVGFDVGGVKETIYPGMGECVSFGDMDALETAVRKWTSAKNDIPAERVSDCTAYNSAARMAGDYIGLYSRLLSGND